MAGTCFQLDTGFGMGAGLWVMERILLYCICEGKMKVCKPQLFHSDWTGKPTSLISQLSERGRLPLKHVAVAVVVEVMVVVVMVMVIMMWRWGQLRSTGLHVCTASSLTH